MNQFKKILNQRNQLYNEYTKILNGLLGLTNKQVLVLTKLLELSDTTPTTLSLLNRNNRKEILESCSIDECNLSTYLTLFKNKSLLVKDTNGRWSVYKNIRPIIINNKMQVSFTLEIKNE